MTHLLEATMAATLRLDHGVLLAQVGSTQHIFQASQP